MKADDIRKAYRAAEMYYINQMNQGEIASKLEVSRSKVSRLLTAARTMNMVKIELTAPEMFDQTSLETKLKKKYGVNHVMVVVPVESGEEGIRKRLGNAIHSYAKDFLKDKKYLGLGWGTTIYDSIRGIPETGDLNELNIIPLLGGLGQSEKAYQINSMVERLASYLGAKPYFLNSPAIFQNKEQLSAILEVPDIKDITEKWKELDVVIFGLGGPIDKSAVLNSNIPDKYILELIRKQAVGDIAARFFDSAGKILCKDLEDILLGIPFDLLMKVPERICTAAGIHKVQGIKAALNSNYITTLITDIQTAQLLAE